MRLLQLLIGFGTWLWGSGRLALTVLFSYRDPTSLRLRRLSGFPQELGLGGPLGI